MIPRRSYDASSASPAFQAARCVTCLRQFRRRLSIGSATRTLVVMSRRGFPPVAPPAAVLVVLLLVAAAAGGARGLRGNAVQPRKLAVGGSGGDSPRRRAAELVKESAHASAMTEAHVPPLQLILAEEGRAEGAVCLDGSAPGFYYRKGYGSGQNNWVLFFEVCSFILPLTLFTFHSPSYPFSLPLPPPPFPSPFPRPPLQGGAWCASPHACEYRARMHLESAKHARSHPLPPPPSPFSPKCQGGAWCASPHACAYRARMHLGSTKHARSIGEMLDKQNGSMQGMLSGSKTVNPDSISPVNLNFIPSVPIRSPLSFPSPQGIPLYMRGRKVADALVKHLMEKKGLDHAEKVRRGEVVLWSSAGRLALLLLGKEPWVWYKVVPVPSQVWYKVVPVILFHPSSTAQVVVTGSSAGGVAALLHCDRVRDTLTAASPSMHVRCLADASMFLDV
ncbi:unnamed protein product [Closterium sp. Yama58-4]|nr:unnamed protein product [Closterium sp. Yama58-4]